MYIYYFAGRDADIKPTANDKIHTERIIEYYYNYNIRIYSL